MVRNHLPMDVFAALKGALLAQLTMRAAKMPPDQNSCLFCIHVILNVNGAVARCELCAFTLRGCSCGRVLGKALLSQAAQSAAGKLCCMLSRRSACAGIRAFRDHPAVGFLYPYFERVRLRDMNAWDISVTMVHASSNAEAFRPHYDRTLTDHMMHTASIGGLRVGSRPLPVHSARDSVHGRQVKWELPEPCRTSFVSVARDPFLTSDTAVLFAHVRFSATYCSVRAWPQYCVHKAVR